MKPTSIRRTLLTTAIAVTLAASACGSSDSATAPSTDAVETDAVETQPIDTESVETESVDSEPVETDAVDTESSSDSIESEPTPDDAADESGSAEPGSDDVDEQLDPDRAEPNPNDPGVDTNPSFIPADEDAPFCTLIDDMTDRPIPSDGFEQLTVAKAWFEQLRQLAVPEITDDLDLMLEFLDTAILANGDIDFNDTSAAVDDASDRIDDYIDERCKGVSDTGGPEEPGQ